MALSAKVEPTERSMPSDKMTQVMPTAIRPLKVAWRKRLVKLLG